MYFLYERLSVRLLASGDGSKRQSKDGVHLIGLLHFNVMPFGLC